MNSDKLVDAIGLLDDNMINNARNPKIKRYPVVIKVIAAVLTVLLVPAVVIFGAGKILGNLGADAADPKYRYAFSEQALASICQQSMYTAVLTTNPPVGVTIGANPPEILYADEEKVVFLTYEGVYVYYYIEERLDTTFSFEKIGVPNAGQGDKATHVSISKDGKYMLLTSSENMSDAYRKYERRIINLKNADMEVLDKTKTPDFDVFATEESIYNPAESDFEFMDEKDFVGTRMASIGDTDFFVMVDTDENFGAVIGNTELVIVNSDGSFSTQRVFGGIFEAYRE